MNKTESHICTECLFTGEPNLSIGRLFIEFFANFLAGSRVGVPLFQKVRHCPECGSHSMVMITSESGQNALTELKKKFIEKRQCDLCSESLSVIESSKDTQLCKNCQRLVFEQRTLHEQQ